MEATKYTERSIAVRGPDTKKYAVELAEMGGLYINGLKDGAGWIFPMKREKEIKDWILKTTENPPEKAKVDLQIYIEKMEKSLNEMTEILQCLKKL